MRHSKKPPAIGSLDPARRGLVALRLAITACCAVGPAHGQNARNELPIPTSPQDDLTAIQRTFKAASPPTLTLFPQLRERMHDRPAFIRDSKFDAHVRSYYRDVITGAPNVAGVVSAFQGMTRHPMKIGIFGAGNIGATLARKLAAGKDAEQVDTVQCRNCPPFLTSDVRMIGFIEIL